MCNYEYIIICIIIILVCLQAALPTDIFAFNFTVERNISEVEDTLRSVLAEQLGVRSIIPLLFLYTYKCSYYY